MNSFRKTRNLRPISTFRLSLIALLVAASPGVFFVAPHARAQSSDGLPPYEQSLRRLSEVVGALMHLDPLCNDSKARDWYEQMDAMLKAEKVDDTRRRQLTDRFNRAYRSFARTYRTCNSQAARVTGIYHLEGQTLLTELKLKHAR